MSTLHVIRHGKASPEAEVYDRLHAIGQAQARKLGEYWAAHAMRFDALYTGPLSRQRDTLQLMRQAAGDVAQSWPAETVIDELAEAKVEVLVKHCLKNLLPTDPKLQAIMQAVGDGRDQAKLRTMIEELLAHTLDLWVSEELSLPGIESARAFGERVERAFERLAAEAGRGREIAVVTSNGVIGYMLAKLSGSADPMRAGFLMRVWNSSVTKILVHDAGLRVVAENSIAHLEDPELHTLL